MNATESATTATPSGKLACIRAYADAGFTLIPLKGKIPTVRNWVETAPGTFPPESLVVGNYGVVLRAGVVVVDIDPRNFTPGDNPVARLVKIIGPLKTYTVKTGGGGYHAYYWKPADLRIVGGLKDFPGIEFKSSGRQVVGPYSVHPDSGKQYEIASGTIQEIAEGPSALLALITQTAVPFAEVGTGKFVNDVATQERYVSYLKDIAEPSLEGKGGDNNAFKVACHGRDLGLPPVLTLDLMLAHWNPRCSPPWDDEELHVKVFNAYKFSKGAVGSDHPSSQFDVVAEIKAPLPKVEEEPISWNLGPKDQVLKTFHNLMNYMKIPAGGLHKIFAYNELSGRNEFVTPAPWHRGKMPRTPGVGGDDLKLLKGYLSTRHGYEDSTKSIEEAVTNVAYHERFHPVRAYLESLKWDGTPRLDTWLQRYLGAVDGGHPDYLRAVSRKVLCAAVMRVFKPGIKFDHVLVLEGPQDLGKSSVCEILGGKWASDAPIDPHSRDTVDAMQGRWIIEIAEMEILRKSDEDALKAFITRKTDRVRLAYGVTTGEFPRQSIFIATKNPRADGTYLRDDTGNRRWWPVRCEGVAPLTQVDFKGLTDARNQLFAEAVHVCRNVGEKLYMETAELKAAAKEVVAQRHAEHEWTERIAAWISERDSRPETRLEFLTQREVFIGALNGTESAFDKRASISISTVLRAIGWVPINKWIVDRPVRGWVRPSKIDALLSEL